MAFPLTQNLTQSSKHYCLFNLAPMTSLSRFLPTLTFCFYIRDSLLFYHRHRDSQLSVLTICFLYLVCRDPQPGHSLICLVTNSMLLSQRDLHDNFIINSISIPRLSLFSFSTLFFLVLYCMDLNYHITYSFIHFQSLLRRYAFHEGKDFVLFALFTFAVFISPEPRKLSVL